MFSTLLSHLKNNWKSGLSIAVVSVPLSISFAIASGAAPIMGLITSAWAGLTAALLGGSNFNVISPAGAFAGILTAVALAYGPGAIPVVTIIAGIIMLIGYLTRAQRFLKFIPGGAIFGFTLGIAGIIAATQINSALGLSGLPAHESILANIAESIRNIHLFDLTTVIIFVAFLLTLMALTRFFKKIPSIIIVTPIGIILGWLATKGFVPLTFATLESTYGSLSASLLQFPTLDFQWGYIVPAITIAVVGILETMLSAKIADGMTGVRHNQKREMLGLSIANVVSGLAGGMPATGVLGPTALNITTGARSRASAAIKAIFVALITLLLFSWFKFIPMPVIAAILFYVAINMVETKQFLLYYKHDRFSLLIALLVAGITLYKDPALGILVGSALGLLLFAEKISRGSFEAVHNSTTSDEKVHVSGTQHFVGETGFDIVVYSFKGVLTHLNGESHMDRIEDIAAPVTHVILRMREVSHVDIEGIQAIDHMIKTLRDKNIVPLVTGISARVQSMLSLHSSEIKSLQENNQVFVKTRYALESLGVPLPNRQ